MNMIEKLEKLMTIKGVNKADISRGAGIPYTTVDGMWKKGTENIKRATLVKLAKFFGCSIDYIADDDIITDINPLPSVPQASNIFPIEIKKVPLIGHIAAGEPIIAEQNFESYVGCGAYVHADFCLRVEGDSMINARIYDGDIVFIREQPDVENGEIAAVLIDNAATLKRVYKMPGMVQLQAENPKYQPMVFTEHNCTEFKILGKAVAFQGDVL